jgi:translation initiation factor 1 (eIF-1/SUI1)
LKELIFDLYLDLVWESKTQPENPKLCSKNAAGSPDCEAMYVIQDKYKVQGDSSKVVVDALVAAGLQEADAKRLVEAELDFTPAYTINLGGLLKGDPDQKAIAEKIIGWVKGKEVKPLSAEEVKQAIVVGAQVEVKGDFICRVCNYARKREDLAAIFNVIQPIEVVRGVKYAISDALDAKTQRLIKKASDIIGGLDVD